MVIICQEEFVLKSNPGLKIQFSFGEYWFEFLLRHQLQPGKSKIFNVFLLINNIHS